MGFHLQFDIVKKDLKTTTSQGSSLAPSEDCDTQSVRMNDTDNEDTTWADKSKAQRSSRSGRRAAQKANERLSAKENILVDEYALPKRRRERLDLKLFPLPVSDGVCEKAKSSLNRQ